VLDRVFWQSGPAIDTDSEGCRNREEREVRGGGCDVAQGEEHDKTWAV